jgi:hypothetical protein
MDDVSFRKTRAIMFAALASLLALGCASLLASASGADPVADIVIDELPSDAAGFERLRNRLASSPEGGVAAFVVALNLYAMDRDLGLACVTMTLHHAPEFVVESAAGPWKGFEPSEKTRYLLSFIDEFPGTARSFIVGTSPEGAYALPPLPWTIRVSRNAYSVKEGGEVMVFVQTSGAGKPRPAYARRNDRGLWKVSGLSSLVMGVKKPSAPDGDDL